MLKKLLPIGLMVILLFMLTVSGCGQKSKPIDPALVDDLLNRFQSGMGNKNAELVASLCAYELNWAGQIFKNEVDLISTLESMFAMIERYEVYEFSNRIINTKVDSATVDTYGRYVSVSKEGTTSSEIIQPVKIIVQKVDKSLKISRLEVSYDIEIYLINDLLNQYQKAMKNMDIDTLVTLCSFPFYDKDTNAAEGTYYDDSTTMQTAYQTKFAETESISAYEIKDRNIGVINPTTGSVFASIRVKKKPLGGDWLDLTYQYTISVKKVNGVWKVSSISRQSQ